MKSSTCGKQEEGRWLPKMLAAFMSGSAVSSKSRAISKEERRHHHHEATAMVSCELSECTLIVIGWVLQLYSHLSMRPSTCFDGWAHPLNPTFR